MKKMMTVCILSKIFSLYQRVTDINQQISGLFSKQLYYLTFTLNRRGFKWPPFYEQI